MSKQKKIARQSSNLSPRKLALLEELIQDSLEAKSYIISKRSEQNYVSLSFSQARLWFMDQLMPGHPVYNMPTVVRLTGSLNLAALEYSFKEIVRRHESLRTSFEIVNNRPVQCIAHDLPLTIPLVDLRQISESKQLVKIKMLASEEACRPFNLAIAPLMRITLLQLGRLEHFLLVTMHHIISDGWSVNILVKELVALYKAFGAGKPSPLPELPIQYGDFAVWQRQFLQGKILQKSISFWKKRISGSPKLKLSTDRPRSKVRAFQGTYQSLELSSTLTEDIIALSRRECATLFMTLATAFKIMLYHHTAQDDITIGTDVANRDNSQLEGLIGFFANQIVLRTNLSKNPSFLELLNRVRQVTTEAYAHKALPFEKLVEVINPKRDISYMPLFQVKFVFQNFPQLDLALPNLTVEQLNDYADNNTAKFDLLLNLEQKNKKIVGILEYSTDLFDYCTISRKIADLKTILKIIVKRPTVRLNEIDKILHTKYTQQQDLKHKKFHEARSHRLKEIRYKNLSFEKFKNK